MRSDERSFLRFSYAGSIFSSIFLFNPGGFYTFYGDL